MSDAKWRKLFGLLEQFPVHAVQWKFIHNEQVATELHLPATLLEHSLGDPSVHPGLPYREIEWIEIPRFIEDRKADSNRPLPLVEQPILEIQRTLEDAGDFPIQSLTSGLRIIGSSWPAEAHEA